MFSLHIFATYTKSLGDAVTNRGMKTFNPSTRRMIAAVNRTSMNLIDIHAGVLAIELFSYDDFLANKVVNPIVNAIIPVRIWFRPREMKRFWVFNIIVFHGLTLMKIYYTVFLRGCPGVSSSSS